MQFDKTGWNSDQNCTQNSTTGEWGGVSRGGGCLGGGGSRGGGSGGGGCSGGHSIDLLPKHLLLHFKMSHLVLVVATIF